MYMRHSISTVFMNPCFPYSLFTKHVIINPLITKTVWELLNYTNVFDYKSVTYTYIAGVYLFSPPCVAVKLWYLGGLYNFISIYGVRPSVWHLSCVGPALSLCELGRHRPAYPYASRNAIGRP